MQGAAEGREATPGDMFNLAQGDMELFPGASRLHELLSRSQREALGYPPQLCFPPLYTLSPPQCASVEFTLLFLASATATQHFREDDN